MICKECGAQIDDTAEVCPFCGAVYEENAGKNEPEPSAAGNDAETEATADTVRDDIHDESADGRSSAYAPKSKVSLKR